MRFSESPIAGLEIAYDGKLLHKEQTPFQSLQVFEHPSFGRMLVLDGLVQTSERDEFAYHEMLVHVPLLSHPDPRRVLIIGGGDGGTLRRVLEHPSVERAVMCEIDERVVEAGRTFLSAISAGALDDPRAQVLVEDGFLFVRNSSEEFDAIIVDSSDPVGPGEILFTSDFYGACRERLGEGGVLCAQAGSPTLMAGDLSRQYANASAAIEDVRIYTGLVPAYPGVTWCYLLGGKRLFVDPIDAGRRADERGIVTRYWTSEVHGAAFALPAFVRRALAGEPGLFSA